MVIIYRLFKPSGWLSYAAQCDQSATVHTKSTKDFKQPDVSPLHVLAGNFHNVQYVWEWDSLNNTASSQTGQPKPPNRVVSTTKEWLSSISNVPLPSPLQTPYFSRFLPRLALRNRHLNRQNRGKGEEARRASEETRCGATIDLQESESNSFEDQP